jgi:hypothetical protein
LHEAAHIEQLRQSGESRLESPVSMRLQSHAKSGGSRQNPGKRPAAQSSDGPASHGPDIFVRAPAHLRGDSFPRGRNTHQQAKEVGKSELLGWCSQQK